MEEYSLIIDREIAKDDPDWDLIENSILNLGDSINKLGYGEENETLLSSIIFDHAEEHGGNLLRLTKLFLGHGYDVAANDGQNGSKCMHNLCWCWGDYNVLPVMELLLEAGADINMGNEDKCDVLTSIRNELCGWTLGHYGRANLFEALYTMVSSFSENKPYKGIRGYEECIGGRLKKVEKLVLGRETIEEDEREEGKFDGALLLWIDDSPLIASVYSDFVIDPYAAEGAVKRMNISSEMNTILNSTFKDIVFLDAYESLLMFRGTDQEDYYFRIWSRQCGPTMSDRSGGYEFGCLKGSPWEIDYNAGRR